MHKGDEMQSDYVIIGAGSAGCAMAYRLSEAGHSVVVLELVAVIVDH